MLGQLKKRTACNTQKSIRIYLELPPSQISMLRFLTEAEDNFALVTVLNPWRATVKICAPAGRLQQVLSFLATTQKSLGLCNLKVIGKNN